MLAYAIKIKSDCKKLLGFNYNISVNCKCNCNLREGRQRGSDEDAHYDKFWWAHWHFQAQPSQRRHKLSCLLASSCSNPRQAGLHGSHHSAWWYLLKNGQPIGSQALETSLMLTHLWLMLSLYSEQTQPKSSMKTPQSPYTAIPTSTCNSRQRAKATNPCSFPKPCLSQLRSWQARAGGGISHFHGPQPGSCVFETASSEGTNKPPLFLPSWGCFRGMLPTTHDAGGQPGSQQSL